MCTFIYFHLIWCKKYPLFIQYQSYKCGSIVHVCCCQIYPFHIPEMLLKFKNWNWSSAPECLTLPCFISCLITIRAHTSPSLPSVALSMVCPIQYHDSGHQVPFKDVSHHNWKPGLMRSEKDEVPSLLDHWQSHRGEFDWLHSIHVFDKSWLPAWNGQQSTEHVLAVHSFCHFPDLLQQDLSPALLCPATLLISLSVVGVHSQGSSRPSEKWVCVGSSLFIVLRVVCIFINWNDGWCLNMDKLGIL